MKGNHNIKQQIAQAVQIVFNKSKIQNERKSQRIIVGLQLIRHCVQQVKDTK